MHLLNAFDSNVRKSPHKPCLRYAGASISYAQVQQRSLRAATALQSAGIGPGDRVALLCLNTPGFVYALLAAWRLGACVVPINHRLQPPEVDFILQHAQCKALVFDAELARIAAAVEHESQLLSTEGRVPGAADFDELVLQGPIGPLPEPPGDQAEAELLYTSGTTGRPKGCLHTQRSVLMAALTAALALSITREERTLIAMPIWHCSPLNNWLWGTLYMGGTVVLLRQYHPQTFLQTVQAEAISLYFGAPVSYFTPLQAIADFARYDLSSVRAWIYGGGPIGADMARQLTQAYRSDRFYQVYGMTETGPTGTTLYPAEQVERAGSIGRVALPGVDMRVVLDSGEDAGASQVGEIWLRADSMMSCYLHDPEASAACMAPGGWYRTGDLARLDEAGYLYIVDRLKDMVITGGQNVYSKEVEDQLSVHPAIADVAVVGRPHPQWGETVVAHVVLKPNAQASRAALQSYLTPRLAPYKIPREFVFTDQLPRNATGKLQKFLLRAAQAST